VPITPTPPPSLPTGPLARWLAHPGATDARILHRLGHALAAAVQGWWPLAASILVLALGCLVAAEVSRARQGRHGRWVAIAPPAEPDPSGGLALWRMLTPLLTAGRSLAGSRPPVAFECHADASGLRIGLWVSPTLPVTGVIGAVESAWPGARATITAPPEVPAGSPVLGGRAKLAAPDWLPLGLKSTGVAAGGDPIRGLLSALSANDDGGEVLFQVLVRPARTRRVTRARRAARALRRGHPTTGVGRALDLLHDRSRTTRSAASADPLALADVRDITAKLTAPPHFEVAVRYAITSPPGATRRDGRRSRRARSREIAAALGLYAGRNHFVARRLARPGTAIGHRMLRRGFLCSLPELAALAHLPAEPAGFGLPSAPARTVAPPPEVAHA
jgi:hypothetical protein